MRFNRRGGPTRSSGDFRGFPADQQQQVLAAAKLAPEEVPVLLSWRDDHSWTLVTTQRALWKNGLAVESLKGSQMEAIVSPVTPSDPRRVPLSPAGLPLAVRVATTRAQVVDLPVEADKTAYGAMHYVLTFVMEASQLKQAPAAAKPAAGRPAGAMPAAKVPLKTR
ncbi:MAG TPA: hypothetical protein VM639_23200 [Dongiaceae bacterium]|nr:hypothetical protein [Dongiaceae bacterium]